MPGEAQLVQKPVVRLVLPFDFRAASLSSAVAALTEARWDGAAELWKPASPRASYVDELSPDAESMLFSGSGDRHAGAHLRLDSTLAQRWLQGAVLAPERRAATPIRLVPEVGIEAFLTGHGAGAISIALELQPSSTSALLDAVYHLAQRARRRGDPMWLRIPHPSEDPERWAAIPEGQRAELDRERAQIPGDDAPLASRLARRGARFTLAELTGALLEPLEAVGATIRDDSFLAYTVARFGAEVSFSDAVSHALTPALVGLAQVEEGSHAGGGVEAVELAFLNAKHVTAVSAQGCAHFVADQEGIGFNEERVPRVRDKYFVPFLVSILQRSALRRVQEDIRKLLARPDRGAEAIRDVRLGLLELGASGMPSETSTRSVVQHYAATCHEVLGVRAIYDRAERAISGIEQVLSSKRMEELLEAQRLTAEKSEKSLHAAHQLHAAVNWLEIFIITAYTAEVIHVLLGAYEHHDGGVHLALYVVPMILAGGIAALLLKPWARSEDHDGKH